VQVASKDHAVVLADGNLEKVMPWGKASMTMGWVFRPTTPTELANLFALARREGLTVGLRGGGNSYGDAACNEGNIVLDLTRMKRILAWDAEAGIITVEPGVRLRDLWEYVLADGWWPPVCTGTMYVTIGGAAAMNVHGKNAYKVGTIGDNIREFDLMLPNGETLTCSRQANDDLFYAAIGGFGMLGCITSLTLQMKRVYSGLLNVSAVNCANLGTMIAEFERRIPDQSTASDDYLVGWVDTTATGAATGRGEIHVANYLQPNEDPYPEQTLRLDAQHLSDTLFGIVPRSAMWRFMRPFFNQTGVPFVNTGKYWSSWLKDGSRYQQPHAQFHFLLNYFPDWEKAAGKHGLIQYQPFVPRASAETVFRRILQISQQRNLAPYLGVLKRHRPDPFLMTHGLDGYSFALDYQVTETNRQAVVELCKSLDTLVLEAGGRFYPAKDSVLRPDVARAYLGDATVERFQALKERCDPEGILQTNFWRRVFA
jgi:FAD/FMN-containing dehydrogenase